MAKIVLLQGVLMSVYTEFITLNSFIEVDT